MCESGDWDTTSIEMLWQAGSTGTSGHTLKQFCVEIWFSQFVAIFVHNFFNFELSSDMGRLITEK